MKIKEIVSVIESIAPVDFQESYDNVGLLVGDEQTEVDSVLLTIDVTENVVNEAISKKCNFIISHHPFIFSGLKKITGKDYIQRILIKAIKNNIAIYACHTNIDSVTGGVNSKIAEKLGLKNSRILKPVQGKLKKLVTFVPVEHIENVRNLIFEAGAGHIGNYDSCSYNLSGEGSFRALEGTNPFVGEKGTIHFEKEIRFETIFPSYLQKKIISALIHAHPYEEVAYDIYQLENEYNKAGMGLIGELEAEINETEFLTLLKNVFKTGVIKHTPFLKKNIRRVAVCGGSGSSFLHDAMAAKADVFVSGDFKYHQFFDADGRILIADIGHFESEQYTTELFSEILKNKISNFTVYLSQINTNPINYF